MIFPDSSIAISEKEDANSSSFVRRGTNHTLRASPPPPPYAISPGCAESIDEMNAPSPSPFCQAMPWGFGRRREQAHDRFGWQRGPNDPRAGEQAMPADPRFGGPGMPTDPRDGPRFGMLGRGGARFGGRGHGRPCFGGRMGGHRWGRGGFSHMHPDMHPVDEDPRVAGHRCTSRRRYIFRRIFLRFVLIFSLSMLWIHSDAVAEAWHKAYASLPAAIVQLFAFLGHVLYLPLAVSQTMGVVFYSALFSVFTTILHAKIQRRKAIRFHLRWAEAARARHSQMHDREAWPAHQHAAHPHPPPFHGPEPHPAFDRPSFAAFTDAPDARDTAAAPGFASASEKAASGSQKSTLLDEEDDDDTMSEKSSQAGRPH